jgi:hypothetical protein
MEAVASLPPSVFRVKGIGDLEAGIGPLEALAAKAHIRKHHDRRQ